MSQTFAGRYHAFGLQWQSALPLPELAAATTDGPADVHVLIGPAPRPAGLVTVEQVSAVGPRHFWLGLDGRVRLLVANGRTMMVEPLGSVAEARAHLLGSGLAALLYQRGIVPLHASSVAVAGTAVALVGASGAGKSTMADHLHAAGHPLLGDDLCPVALDGAADAITWPGIGSVKLWSEAVAATGRTSGALEQVVAGIDKFRVPLATAPDRARVRLQAVVELGAGDGPPRVERLAGSAAVSLLLAHSFRGLLVRPMGLDAAHLAACLAIAKRIAVLRLTRPLRFDALPATRDALLAAL